MFCTKCGQQNSDDSTFCIQCGNSMKGTVPAPKEQTPPNTYSSVQGQNVLPVQTVPVQATPVQVTPVQVTPFQTTPIQAAPPQTNTANTPVKTRKKSHKGLIIGLVAGFLVLIAGVVLVIVVLNNLAAGNGSKETVNEFPLTGLWSSEERAEVLKFKDNGSVYLYSYEDDVKGDYEYDKDQSNGVITLDDTSYDFEVADFEMDVEDMGVYTMVDDEEFDIDEFIEDNYADSSSAETTSPDVTDTTAAAATTAATTAAVETVTDMSLTLSLSFGDRDGTYSGEIENGLPNGYGTFTSTNSEVLIWEYEGMFVDGHFEGQGATGWEDGFAEAGEYKNDLLNGEGQEYWYDVLRYQGSYTDGVENGTGTLYNHHGEVIFTGTFNYGFIQETTEARSARVGAFKDLCIPATWDELYASCESEIGIYTQITGTVFDVFEYYEDQQYYCDFLMYEQGVEETTRIVQVYYRLSEGQSIVTVGQTVSVWGTTEYLYSYTSNSNEAIVAPLIEAWSVE